MNEEDIWIKDIPEFLKKDIDALLKAEKEEKCLVFDCLLDEVYGSINSALHSYLITEDQADYLRNKYYFGKQHLLKTKLKK